MSSREAGDAVWDKMSLHLERPGRGQEIKAAFSPDPLRPGAVVAAAPGGAAPKTHGL